jgi:hypothetical protein
MIASPPPAMDSAGTAFLVFEVLAVVFTILLGVAEILAFRCGERKTARTRKRRLEIAGLALLLLLGIAEGIALIYGHARDEMAATYEAQLADRLASQEPRHLDDRQRTELRNLLASFGPQTIQMVTSKQNDAEAADYARELVATVQSAGWSVTIPAATMIPSDATEFDGLWISVRDIKHPSRAGDYLYTAFTRAGLHDVHAYEDTRVGPEECSLYVAHRPKGPLGR